MRRTAQVISGHLTNSVSQFAQAVANGENGENVWESLAGAIKSAIAQILIDTGRMIVETIIANAIMTAMGFPPGGAQGAAGAGGGGQNILATLISSMFSAGMPTFHQGGVAGERAVRTSLADVASGGLRSNELIALLEEDEEILTRDDPRHRYNLKIRKYHSGGIAGLDADRLTASIASTRSNLSEQVKMFKDEENALSEQNVRIVNLLDSHDVANAALSGPAGEKVMMNVISRNRAKVKAMLK